MDGASGVQPGAPRGSGGHWFASPANPLEDRELPLVQLVADFGDESYVLG
jgi:hypothetical protein